MPGSFLTASRAINHAADGVAHTMEVFGNLATSLSGALNTCDEKANSMGQSADMTQTQSTTVAAGAEEALNNVQTVASAAEELSSSIQEINRQVTQSTTISAEAVTESQKTSEIIGRLSSTSENIGAVIEMISNIASQTNLLALNATIEAARSSTRCGSTRNSLSRPSWKTEYYKDQSLKGGLAKDLSQAELPV